MGETVRFGVSLDIDLLDDFDALIKRMGYENRSEAIRDLIRDKLVQEEWRAPRDETFAAVFIVYDHDAMAVDKRLTNLQHEQFGRVVSCLHVHVDEHNCLEVIVLKGPGEEIRRLGEGLVGMRGVKYGKLNMGTSGKKMR